MLRPTAVKVEPQNDYKLLLEFDNNEKRLFDVKPYIRGEWFGELLDKNYFRAVTVNGYSVE